MGCGLPLCWLHCLLGEPSDIICLDYMHHLGCVSMLCWWGTSTTLLFCDIHVVTSTQLVWLHRHHSLVLVVDALLVVGGGGCQAWSFACTNCT